MNDVARQKLGQLIAAYGPSLCDDPRRCEALLRDYCPGYKREIHVLVNALRERVAADLLRSQNGTPYEVQLARLTRRLRDNFGLVDEAAAWAVESWALALGVIATPTQESKPAAEKSSSETTRRPSKKRASRPVSTRPVSVEQSGPSVEKSLDRENKPQFSTIRVTDRRASSGLSDVRDLDSQISAEKQTAPTAGPEPPRNLKTPSAAKIGAMILLFPLLVFGNIALVIGSAMIAFLPLFLVLSALGIDYNHLGSTAQAILGIVILGLMFVIASLLYSWLTPVWNRIKAKVQGSQTAQ